MREMKYDGSSDSETSARNLQARRRSTVPLWRRWMDGFILAIAPVMLLYVLGWIYRTLGVPDWNHDLLRGSVQLLAVLAVFALFPLLIYEFAYQIVVIPWLSKYVREAHLVHIDEAVQVESQTD